MQFTTALIALTAAVATTVSAIPTTPAPSTKLNPQTAICRTQGSVNDQDLVVEGVRFARLYNRDFPGNDIRRILEVKYPVVCAEKCAQWNANPASANNKCVGWSHLGEGTTLEGRKNECWLKKSTPGCGTQRPFFVTSGLVDCEA